MPRTDERRFATILFTDIVGSTDIAAELGDRRWRELVARHHAIVRSELKRFEGREVDTAGDGFFATFDSPGAAIRCACAISEAVREVGLEVRAGLHAGEVETAGGKAGGIAVNTAARVMAVGGPGEVLVSSSLHDVVAGSNLSFADHGTHQLKGIAGEWRLFGVVSIDGTERGGVLDAAEAAKRRYAIEPSEARPRRWTPILAAGVIGVVLLGGALAFVLSRDDGGGSDPTGPKSSGSAPGPGSVASIDIASGELVLEIDDVPQSSTPQFENEDLEIGEGAVWLVRGGLVMKVDPADGSAEQAAPGIATTGNQGIDTGFGTVWLLHDELYPVNPGSGDPGDPIMLSDLNPDLRVNDVAAGLDDVWVVSIDGELFRVDPQTLEFERFRIGGTTEHVAVGTDAVWIADEFEGIVSRFDVASAEVVDRVELTGGLDAIVAGEGFIWVLDSTLSTLTPIEESTGDPRAPIQVGEDAEDVAVGGGSVWVASGGSILEINPATLQVVRTIDVGPTPILEVGVDTASSALWISMEGTG